MVRLGNIFERLTEIGIKTLRNPTHIVVSYETSKDLVSQYNEIANSDSDSVLDVGKNKYTLEDVGYFLGVKICIGNIAINEFKILEEITTNS